MKVKKTKFCSDLGVPVVKGFIHGIPFNAILDTGSEETLIDVDFVKKNKKFFSLTKTDYKINFSGIHGDKDTRIVHAETDITFKYNNGKTFDVSLENAVIYNMSFLNNTVRNKGFEIHALLGSRFFSSKNAEINYDTKELIFNICQTKPAR